MRVAQEKEEEAVAASPPPEKVLYDNRIKRKNVLALNEKVSAIREYEKMPVYKRIGRMFHCSPDQIKRIVQQKDSILKAWEQRTRRCQDAKTLQLKVVRVSMLGKAVYDWIRRMMYYKDINITDGLIQKMALQFRTAMGLQNFFPHQEWCDKFRQTYNIIETDSKKLKIGYTQGHSVQIKDVIKDVLSEYTPDVVDNDEENNGERRDENERTAHTTADTPLPEKRLNISQTTTKLASVTTHPNQTPDVVTQATMPHLQPYRQLVALPIQTNGIRMPQKVLVATPITQTGHIPGTSPMTMTIIPLATIAQRHNISDKQSMPPPRVEIKQEVKDEPAEAMDEASGVQIKQECMSEEEDDENMSETHDSAANSETNDDGQEQTQQVQPEPLPSTTVIVNCVDSAIATRADEPDTMDYDNLALSSLRKIIQDKETTVPLVINSGQRAGDCDESVLKASDITDEEKERNASTEAKTPALPPLQPSPTCSFPSLASLPPLPPLKKAPTLIHSHAANKRKHKLDTTPFALPAIQTCAEARRVLRLLEDFALMKESFRLIGLITRADEVVRELDGDQDIDVD